VLLNVVHININVTDIDRSLEFYQKVGFVVMHVFGGNEAGGDGTESNMRGVVLSLSDDPRASTKIELLQWIDPPAAPQPERVDGQAGVARIAIRTKNLLSYCEELRARGIEFLHEPQEIDIVGAKRFVLFKDPDGTILELIEF
jgi:catechol 2,3-dioxygenase-like lactoylglutathione lyase family enzyme